uniref:UDP-glucuronosyltransferase n=1 Tax=Arion vulgaris TaxID=1028688 RepID=A0A0B7BTZ9_9EUPU
MQDIQIHSVRKLLMITATFLTLTVATNAKTVVFFPPPSTSYIVYHTNVAGELTSMGHDVWICVPHFLISKDLVKDKSVKVLEYGEYLGDLETKIFRNTKMASKFWDKDYAIEPVTFYYYAAEFTKAAHEILSDKSFLNTLRALKPDLFVIESIPFNVNMVVLPYMLDVPFALIGTFHDVALSRVPFSVVAPYFPDDKLSDKMSFVQRLQNFVFYIIQISFDLFYDSNLVTKFAPHKPYKSLNDLAATAEIFIAEVDHILDYPRSMLPNTKLIGGSSASPVKPLVGDFKKFVDQSKRGIIVVSFGGHVMSIPQTIASKLLSAFQQLDLDVVWRVNITSPDPSRIMTSKWIPQNDLLGHEKTKLFISHCGKNGQYEALYHAVPILCLPIYGDQKYNSVRIKVKQLGLFADMRTASADELTSMIKQIVYDSKYAENMKKASRLYRELYKVPKKEAAYWLDHVMEYGGAYMRSPCQEMPWYKIYALDIIAFIVVIIIFLIVLLYLLITKLYKCWIRSNLVRKPKRE